MIGAAAVAGGRKWLALWAVLSFAAFFSVASAARRNAMKVVLTDQDGKAVAKGVGLLSAFPEVQIDFVKSNSAGGGHWEVTPNVPMFQRSIKSVFDFKTDVVKVFTKSGSKAEVVALPEGVIVAKHPNAVNPLVVKAVRLFDHNEVKRVFQPTVQAGGSGHKKRVSSGIQKFKALFEPKEKEELHKTKAPKKKLYEVFDGFDNRQFAGYVGAHTKVHADGKVNLPTQEELKAFYDAFYTPELSAKRRAAYDAAVDAKQLELFGISLYDLKGNLIEFEDFERKVFLKKATDKKDQMYHKLGVVAYGNDEDHPVPTKRHHSA